MTTTYHCVLQDKLDIKGTWLEGSVGRARVVDMSSPAKINANVTSLVDAIQS